MHCPAARLEFLIIVLSSCCISGHGSIPLGEVRGTGEEGRGYSYVYVGETLQLNCTLSDSTTWQAQDLEIVLDNDFCEDNVCNISKDQVHIINNRTLQMKRLVTGVQDAGEYICWVVTPQMEYKNVSSLMVFVQYQLQEVTNILCHAYNWDASLTCSWNYGVEYIDNQIPVPQSPDAIISSDITVHVSLLTRQGISDPCPHEVSPLKASQCVWDRDHFRAASRYLVNVTIRNEITHENKGKMFPITTSEIVKPAPVDNIWAQEKNSTCVTLAWNHSRVHRDKFFRLNYTRAQEDSNMWLFFNTASMEYVCCGLLPYTTNTFSVECHAGKINAPKGFWSDAKSVNISTAEAEPKSSFKVENGSYILEPCNREGKTNVTIFWKAVPPPDRNGQIIGYRLIYNGTTVDVNSSSPTSAVVQDVACGSSLLVRIFSRTKVGASAANSRLLIITDAKDPVSDFAVEVSADQGLRAVWNSSTDKGVLYSSNEGTGGHWKRGSGDSVTVFWCLRDKTAGNRVCKGEVQWISTQLSAGELVIPQQFPHPQQIGPGDFLFGISYRGQPIAWTSCLFERQAPILAPEGVKVVLVQQQKQLDIQWHQQKCSNDYPVHVIGYRINVCETHRCHDTSRTVEVKGSKSSYATVPGNEGVEYNITVQAFTLEGRQGPYSEPVVVAIEPRQASTPLGLIAGSVLAALALLSAVLVVCKCYHRVRHTKKKFGNLDLTNDQPGLGGTHQLEDYTTVPTSGSPSHTRQSGHLSHSSGTAVTTVQTTSERMGEAGGSGSVVETHNSSGLPEQAPLTSTVWGLSDSYLPQDPAPVPPHQPAAHVPPDCLYTQAMAPQDSAQADGRGGSPSVDTCSVVSVPLLLSEPVTAVHNSFDIKGSPDCVTSCFPDAPSVLGGEVSTPVVPYILRPGSSGNLTAAQQGANPQAEVASYAKISCNSDTGYQELSDGSGVPTPLISSNGHHEQTTILEVPTPLIITPSSETENGGRHEQVGIDGEPTTPVITPSSETENGGRHEQVGIDGEPTSLVSTPSSENNGRDNVSAYVQLV